MPWVSWLMLSRMFRIIFTVSNDFTKPVFNLEDVKKEIAEMNKKFEPTVSNSDTIAMVNLYTADAKDGNGRVKSAYYFYPTSFVDYIF